MRIISGKYGGRRISPPANMPHTRPTTDVAKEGLFNILQSRINLDGASTLDLFGGTGCISYELASRGATALTIVEKDNQMLDFIKQNIELLKIENVQILRMDVFQYLNTCTQQFDFIFADLPCSGSGTWGRTPENLQSYKETQLNTMTKLQENILHHLMPAIKIGGYLLAATCSVYKNENEDQIEKLVATGKFKLVDQQYFIGYDKHADTLFGALLQKMAD